LRKRGHETVPRGEGVVSAAKGAARLPAGKAGAAGAGRYKPYPTYKDSGVEWLGEVPAHWEVKRLKHLATLNPESLMEDTDPTREMVYVDIGGVDSLGRVVEREQLTFATAPFRARRLVRDGDVIVSTVRTYLRAIAPISDPEPGMVVSTGFAVVRPADDLTTDYAAYALRAPYFVERVVANSKGVSFPAINESEMATYELASPPEPEQRAIAAFLDRETARIDALVAKKERLIALLEEQRTALITRAVTKGLDPTVPMKDSGVEWLGEIPAHWEVKPIRALARPGYKTFTDGDWIESPFIRDEGIRLIQTGNIGIGEYKEQGFRYIDEETFRAFRCTEFLPGDVLICRLADPVGRACLAPNLGCRMITSVDVCILKWADDVHAAFLVYSLSSAEYLAWRGGICRGGTRDRVSRSMLGAIRVQKPPLAEQLAIAAFLDRESARIDALVAKVRDAIDRLKELRTALISAAVTGKIDVRPPTEASAQAG